jgi:hypothetical protein
VAAVSLRLLADELETLDASRTEARREGAEQGWDEGHRAGWHNHRDGKRPPIRENPYRQANGATA